MQQRVPSFIDRIAHRVEGYLVDWRAGRLLARNGKTAAFILIVVTLVLAGVHLWQSRLEEVERTKATAGNLVHLLREQTHAVFHASDLTLRIVEAQLENRSGLPANDADFRAYLQSLNDRQPYVRALFVIGSDGFLSHDTDYPETPRVSLADRDYFTVHQRNPDAEMYVGGPLMSRSVRRWFVPMSRRVDGPDGSFEGVVVAAVEPRFFEHVYRRLSLSQHDSVALFHADSTLIARAPALQDLYGRQWPEGPLFSEYLPQSSEGVFAGNTFGGRCATIGYTTVGRFPLVVTTALDRETALAGWRGSAWVVGFGVLFIALMILLLFATLNRRRLEMELVQQRALMANKLETIGQMTGSVAHDFNNVLATVSAGVGLIRRRGATDAFLDGIQQAVERGSALTTGLLDFAKRQEYVRRTENPIELLKSLDLVMRQLAGRNVRISTNYADSPCDCLIDRAQFDACILNLVANASHAMPDGGTISIDAGKIEPPPGDSLEAGEYAHIRIADTGTGISPETLGRVFEPFYSTKGDSGTGLGLTQVRSFMKEMGGDVRISSAVGAGTRIDLYFPCSAPDKSVSGDQRGESAFATSME